MSLHSLANLSSGRSIIRGNRERLKQSSKRSDMMEIQDALARLDYAALTFQDTSAGPHPLGVLEYYLTYPAAVVPEHGFDSLAEAHRSLTV